MCFRIIGLLVVPCWPCATPRPILPLTGLWHVWHQREFQRLLCRIPLFESPRIRLMLFPKQLVYGGLFISTKQGFYIRQNRYRSGSAGGWRPVGWALDFCVPVTVGAHLVSLVIVSALTAVEHVMCPFVKKYTLITYNGCTELDGYTFICFWKNTALHGHAYWTLLM